MKLLYISSPFESPKQFKGIWSRPTEEEIQRRIKAADELGIEALEAGWIPIIMHKNNAGWQHLGRDPESWYEMDLDVLARCDAILVNDGYHESYNSKGMKLETQFAKEHCIPVILKMSPSFCLPDERTLVKHFPTPEEIFGIDNENTLTPEGTAGDSLKE